MYFTPSNALASLRRDVMLLKRRHYSSKGSPVKPSRPNLMKSQMKKEHASDVRSMLVKGNKDLPIMTRVPFLDTTAYSQPNNVKNFIDAVKGNSLFTIHRKCVKGLFSFKYLPHLDSKFWKHTHEHSGLAAAALAEAIETNTIDRLKDIMTPASHMILKENFAEFDAGRNYRLNIESISPKFLNVEYIVNFPQFENEHTAYIEPVRGLQLNYSIPDNVHADGDYTRMLYMKMMALKEFQNKKLNYLLSLSKKNLIHRSQLPNPETMQASLDVKSGAMSPLIFKSSIGSFKEYMTSVGKMDGDFIKENATVSLRASYLIDCKHSMDIWDKTTNENVRTLYKKPFSHILTIENEVGLDDKNPNYGQWRISDFDSMVKTEAYAFKNFMRSPSKYLHEPPPKDIDTLKLLLKGENLGVEKKSIPIKTMPSKNVVKKKTK